MAAKKHLPERTDLPIPERYVTMSNAVARSSQGLGLVEKRVIAIGLAKTDSIPAADLLKASKEGWRIKFTAAEYAESYDLDPNTAYEQLKQAGEHFLKRTITRMEKDHKGRTIVHRYNWLSGTTYHHGEGWVEIRFSFEVAPHLLGLRTKFVSYKLKQASALRSVYAWRLFECLQSWKDKGRWVVDVDEFNDIMETPQSFRLNFGMMRRRVIDPAIKELREKDNFDIQLDLVKAGRKVTGLCFTFAPCAQKTLDL